METLSCLENINGERRPRRLFLKLLIVDGNNFMCQMFYGIPSRIKNKEGKTIHGAVGFIGGLVKCMKIIKPTHVIVVFDGLGYNHRKEIYRGYKRNRIKSNRNPEGENPVQQMPEIERMLAYMNITYTCIHETEADDVIASYTIRYMEKLEVVILSSDKDFYQLIGPNVQVYSYKGKQLSLYDSKKIKEEYGLEPWQLVDFQSILGDSSDNIRGIPRIGAKIAKELIQEYHTMAELIHHCDTAAQLPIERLILKSKKKLLRNYQLIILVDKIPDLLDINQLIYEIEWVEPMNKIIGESNVY